MGQFFPFSLQLCPTPGFDALIPSSISHKSTINALLLYVTGLKQGPRPKKSGGEALLEEFTPLVLRFPHNQALMCLQARQLLHLGRYQEALLAVVPCLGCGNDLAPSRWALHLTVHAHWLTGGLDQVCPHLQPQQMAETGSHSQPEQLAETSSHLLTNVAIHSCKFCIVSQLFPF